MIGESDLGLNFIKSLHPVRYKLKVRENTYTRIATGKRITVTDPQSGEVKEVDEYKAQYIPSEGRRIHYGLVAQHVKDALSSAGLNPSACAMWTLDDPGDPESRQGLRYDNLIAPLIRAIQELSAKVDAQAEQIARLAG